MKFLLLIITTFFSCFAFSQREDHTWYFGDSNKGFFFDYISNNLTLTYEHQPLIFAGAYFVASDSTTGQLFFYTDGTTIFDKNHLAMPSGVGLTNGAHTLQTGLCCYNPGHPNQFIIFNNASNAPASGNIYYSIIDMTLQGNGTTSNPSGDVILGMKNVFLTDQATEGMMIIPGICETYWLIVPVISSNLIKVFKIDSSGIYLNDVIDIGYNVGACNQVRYSSVSEKIGLAVMPENVPSLVMDFNKNNGNISNVFPIPGLVQGSSTYGCGICDVEWSPSGTKLYISRYRGCSPSTAGQLLQYDITTPTIAAVQIASMGSSNSYSSRGLKLAPNGKIYLFHGLTSNTYIGAINNPDASGAACNYNATAINMGSALGQIHKFPEFLTPVETIDVSVNDAIICSGQSATLTAIGATAYVWNNGLDTNHQQIVSPANTTSYIVTGTTGTCVTSDTAIVTVNQNPTPLITGNLLFCAGDSTVLDAGSGYVFYNWSQGGHMQSINVTTAGTYSVTVTNANGCTGTSQVIVTVSPPLTSVISGATSFCSGSSTLLDAGSGYVGYVWSDGLTTQTINVTTGGVYSVTVTNSLGCTGSEQINISQLTNPSPLITGLLSLCTGYSTNLSVNVGYTLYLWSNAAVTSSITVTTGGNYGVTVTDNNGCTGTSQVMVTEGSNLSPVISGDLQICNGTSTILNSGAGYADYIWSGGETDQSINVNTGGNYSVTVSNVSGCTGVATVTVLIMPNPIPVITGNFSMCSGGITTIDAGSGFSTYLWTGGSANQTLNVISSGTYIVTVTNSFGCSGTDSATVSNGVQVNATSENSICPGEWVYLTATAFGGSMPYTYYWNNVTGSASIGVQPNATTSYSVYVVDANGCTSNTAVAVVNVLPLLQMEMVISATSICPGEPVQLNVNVIQGGGPPYTIYNSSGNVLIPPITICPQNSGPQWLYLQDGCGSLAHDSVYITVNSPPVVNFVSDTMAGCEPLTVAFTPMNPQPGQTYLWNFGDGSYNQISYDMNPIHYFTQDGIFNITLTITNSFGCTSSYTHYQMIRVYPAPDARFIAYPSSVSIIKPLIHFINLSEGASTYIWSFGDGDSSSIVSPWHWYSVLGSYVVQLIAFSDMDCPDTARSTIIIRDEYTFYAPTAISPDLDEVNDVFYVLGNGISEKDFHLYIFDRWGEVIFETNKYDSETPWIYGWDGRAKGHDVVPIGSYTWLVKYYDGDHIQHDKTGVVNVIR